MMRWWRRNKLAEIDGGVDSKEKKAQIRQSCEGCEWKEQ